MFYLLFSFIYQQINIQLSLRPKGIFCIQNLMQLYSLMCTLFSVVIGLHLQFTNPLNNNSLYFQQQFTQMISQVDYVSRTLNLNDSNKFQFLIEKANQVEEGLTALKKCLQKNNLLINHNIHLCPRVSTFNRTEIRRYIIYIEDKQWTINKYMETCVDCKFIKKDIDNMENTSSSFIREVNDTLNGKFCIDKQLKQQATGMVDLNLSYFRNNLEAQNWYYGSTTPTDYKIYLFKRASTYNLTSCPITTPYVRGNSQACFNCPEGSLFNLGSQRCDSCPLNEILNIQDGSCSLCLGERININGSLQCRPCKIFQGELFNKSDGSCYKCEINSYLDYEAKQCISISCDPHTPRFNMGTKKCQACGISQIINPKDPTACLKTNYMAVCPPESPYYNKTDYKCSSCPINTKYNVQQNLCQ